MNKPELQDYSLAHFIIKHYAKQLLFINNSYSRKRRGHHPPKPPNRLQKLTYSGINEFLIQVSIIVHLVKNAKINVRRQ